MDYYKFQKNLLKTIGLRTFTEKLKKLSALKTNMEQKTIGQLVLILLPLFVLTFFISTANAAPPKPWPGSYNAIINNSTNSIAIRNSVYDFFDKFGILNKFKLLSTVPNYTPVKGTFDQYYDNYFIPTVNSLLAKGYFNEDLDLMQKLLDARVSFTIDDIKTRAGANEILLLIMFENNDLDQDRILNVVSTAGGQLKQIFNIIPAISVSVERDKLATFTILMRNSFNINNIEVSSRNYINLDQSVPMIFEPGTEKGQRQWIEEKWAHGPINGKGIIIAILDTGINNLHPDLNDIDDDPTTNDPKVTFSKKIVDRGLLSDGSGHGTHVASILSGTGKASNGKFVGVAPGAKLYNIKVLDDDGANEGWETIEGIQWAVNGPDGIPPGGPGPGENGDRADIISMSLGGQEFPFHFNDTEVAAVEAAIAKGIIVVVAAGNDGRNGYSTIGSPGKAPDAITVGAVDKDGHLAFFSSMGPAPIIPYIDNYETPYLVKPDVVAPGVDICAVKVINGNLDDNHQYSMICNSDQYGALSGTSMATPHVAGAAALILQMHPNWTPAQVKSAIVQMARPLEDLEGNKYDVFKQGTGLIVVGDSLRFGGEVIPPVINAGVYDSTNPLLPPIEIDFQGFNYNQNGKCYGLKIDSIKTKYIETGEDTEDLWDFPTGNMQLNALGNINFHLERLLSDLLPGKYATRFELDYYESCDFSLPEPTKVLQIPIGFFVK